VLPSPLHHQAVKVDSCPDNQLLWQESTGDPTITTGTTTGVAYQSLEGAGWDVLPERPSSTSADALATLFQKDDFWSVMCNSNGQFGTDRKTCAGDGRQGPLGAVHVRYDCGANENDGTLWILT
jgi:hypothetical protein